MKFLLLLTLPLLFVSASEIHDYHVSKCLVKYNSHEKALQIGLHLFIDDVEKAMAQDGQEKMFIGSELEKEGAEAQLIAYIRHRLQFKIDGRFHRLEWVGKETTEDLSGIWCYLEVSDLERPNEIEITNRLLLEVYDDQKNLVSFNLDDSGEVYYLFRNGKESDRILIPGDNQ